MLIDLLIGILAIIGGLVLVAVVAVTIAYFLIARRLSLKMQHTVSQMESLLANSIASDFVDRAQAAAHGNVPPMRIHLEPTTTEVWAKEPTAQPIDEWLLRHSFQRIGDFRITEMFGERLRVYVSEDRLLVAAMRHPLDGTQPYVEFCFDLGNGVRGGVSNPPGATVPLPPTAVGKYFAGDLSQDFELLSQMWLEAKDLVDAHTVQPVDPQHITAFFEEAHAVEMDNRIACGGVTEDEIRASLTAQGVDPSEHDIEEIQAQWQQAIATHLLNYSDRGRMQHAAGREILVVYDASLQSYLQNRIGSVLRCSQEFDQYQLTAIANELKLLLKSFSPREAMARFRPLLPNSLRYDLVDQLQQPVEADLYVLPSA